MGKKAPPSAKAAMAGVGRDIVTSGLASMGHALGVAAAKKHLKTRKSKRGNKNATRSMAALTSHISNMSVSRAPVTLGYSYSGINKKKNPIITLPFNAISNCYLGVGSVAGQGFVNSSGSAASSSFDLNPFTNTVAGYQANPFGLGISNVTKSFSKWRIKSLRVTYIPAVATNVSGTFVLGATGENFIQNTPTFQQVSDCERMMSGPLWTMQSVDITSVARNNPNQWLYCYVNGTTVSEQRQNYCCTLLVAFFNAPSATNSNFGQLRFDGVIEFTDMSDVIGGVSEEAPTSSSLPPQALPAASSPPIHMVKAVESLPTDVSREVSGSIHSPPNSLGPDGRWYIPSTVGTLPQR